ncbi:MAG: phosphotransferase family protein [Alphaproteobacteria bacterium]|nr:phosphotransferase family protein [Alphaproteobacteria bacterium]
MSIKPVKTGQETDAETIAVRPGEGMQWDALVAYLRPHLEGLPRDVQIRQFPGGHANLTYLLSTGEKEWVVRRPPLGPLPKNAHDMAREYRVLSRLNAAYGRAPKAYHLCEDIDVIGAPFLVAERRRGVVLRRDWPENFKVLDKLEERISYALIDALADLHLVDAEAIGLGDLGRPQGFVARQVKGWGERWHAAKDKELLVFDEVHGELIRQLPDSPRVSVLHNDFKLDNCMVDDGAPDRITAVFDWDMATLGDPLIDLGTFFNYWPSEDGQFSWDKMPPFVTTTYPRRADLIARYGERTGFDVAGMNWYEAFALWKTAVVVQQIYIRYARGQTDDERFATYGGYAEPLFEAARVLLAR